MRKLFTKENIWKPLLVLQLVLLIFQVVTGINERRNLSNLRAALEMLNELEQVQSIEMYSLLDGSRTVYDTPEEIQMLSELYDNTNVCWTPDRSVKKGLELLYTVDIHSSDEWLAEEEKASVFEVYGSPIPVDHDGRRASFEVEGRYYLLFYQNHICYMNVLGSGREISLKEWRLSNLPFSERKMMSDDVRESLGNGGSGHPDDRGFYGDYEYLIFNVEGGGQRAVLRDTEVKKLHHLYTFHSPLSEEAYSSIEPGISTSADVEKIDAFLYILEKENRQAVSEHLIDGGRALTIEYELVGTDWLVSDMRIDEDESGMADFIEFYCSSPVRLELTNVPYSIRAQSSLVLRKSDVIKMSGEPDESGSYREFDYLIYRSDEGAETFLVFREADILHHAYTCDRIPAEDDFSNLEEGISTEEDVRRIDPFLTLFGNAESRVTSEHLLKESRKVTIEYLPMDRTWVVDRVTFADDASGIAVLIEKYYAE